MNLAKRLDKARTLFQQKKFAASALAYETLTRACSQNASIWFEYGCAAGSAGQTDVLERAWQRATKLEPANGEMQLQMGHHYVNLRQMENTRAAFERAAALDPGAVDPRIALAMHHERVHQLEQARDAVEACLKLSPKDDQARYFSAFLDRRENKLEDAERRLRELISSEPQHEYVQYASRFELAEVYNRTERFDEAMLMLTEAKSLISKLGNLDAALASWDNSIGKIKCSLLSLPMNILQTWGRDFPPKERNPATKLAFLGGHPRSGTTLLEQVLGTHPGVVSLDESVHFDRVAVPLYHATTQWPPARLNFIRQKYLQACAAELGGLKEGQTLLDKNPSGTIRLAWWLRIFPELRVIIALRDPRDVVISCFFQNLPITTANANFLSLERTAKHYADLMDIWLAVRQWEGVAWVETRYEDTVANLEKEGTRVTEFLGLSWHEDQSRFYEKNGQRRLHSPTYHDASQPVYKRAVARWRSYEKHLLPVLPVLEPYCRALGYET